MIFSPSPEFLELVPRPEILPSPLKGEGATIHFLVAE